MKNNPSSASLPSPGPNRPSPPEILFSNLELRCKIFQQQHQHPKRQAGISEDYKDISSAALLVARLETKSRQAESFSRP